MRRDHKKGFVGNYGIFERSINEFCGLLEVQLHDFAFGADKLLVI